MGFATRQYTNVNLNVLYKEKAKSTDRKGILLKEKDANGRKILSETTLNGEKYVRVASSAMTGMNNIVCGDEISHDVYIEYLDKYNKDKNATSVEKYTSMDGSCIGIAFGSAITESLTQNGLSFKHKLTCACKNT